VKVTAKNLTKLAARFLGQEGYVVSVTRMHGIDQYRVKFEKGKAVYLEGEIMEVEDE